MVNPDAVRQAVEKAWDNGHLLMGFTSDTEESVVTECLRCERVIGVDGGMVNDGLGGECSG